MGKQTNYTFIRYANCWEDTEILLEALDIKEGGVGLSVASAGDNTLALLIKNPKKIYAFDLNKTQLYCLELKMACFKLLPYEKMISFLGITNQYNRITIYKTIRHELSSEGRKYFDKNLHIIKNGIIHTGKFEKYFRIFRNCVIPLFSTKSIFYEFSKMNNLTQQKTFYDEKINNRRLKTLFNIYFGSNVMGRLGRDKRFYKYVEDKKESGQDIKKRFEYGISNTINKTNPYLNYIANNNYSVASLPVYLRKENYHKIKKNIDKITIIHGDLLSIKDLKFDFFNLSDIFEYMSENEFQQNIKQLKRLSNDNAVIVYWNMQNKRYIDNKQFELKKELSDKLFKKNQSYFYRDFLIYRVPSQINLLRHGGL